MQWLNASNHLWLAVFLQKLKHPNIIQLYDVFEDDEEVHFVRACGEKLPRAARKLTPAHAWGVRALAGHGAVSWG